MIELLLQSISRSDVLPPVHRILAISAFVRLLKTVESWCAMSRGLCVFMWFRIALVHAEVFSSVADIEALIEKELRVFDRLKEIRSEYENRMAAIDAYLQKFETLRDIKEPKDLRNMMTNPIEAYRLVRHLVDDYGDLTRKLDLRKLNETFMDLQAFRRESNFPTVHDIKGIAEAFVRLQQTYKVHPNDFADGRVQKFLKPSMPFTADECFNIGWHQAQLGQERKEARFHHSAVYWLKNALSRHNERTKSGRSDILDWLQYSMFNAGYNLLKVIAVLEELERTDPSYVTTRNKLRLYRKMFEEKTESEQKELRERFTEADPEYEFGTSKFEVLCRGEGQLSKEAQSQQKCYLETYGNPVLLIQPVKREVVLTDPEINVLHEVLTDKEMEAIREVGMKYIQRAKVVSEDDASGRDVSHARVSKTAFLEPTLDPTIKRINLYSGIIANLNPIQAEDLQINNYGIGGLYLPHFDFFRDPAKVGGDRIATLMYYMSDVEAGGATVFPEVNVTLFPKKGSAAFWFNLRKDGKGDERTLHAGCPVLVGTKWVSNKWFREPQQDVFRPCLDKPDSPQPENSDTMSS